MFSLYCPALPKDDNHRRSVIPEQQVYSSPLFDGVLSTTTRLTDTRLPVARDNICERDDIRSEEIVDDMLVMFKWVCSKYVCV